MPRSAFGGQATGIASIETENTERGLLGRSEQRGQPPLTAAIVAATAKSLQQSPAHTAILRQVFVPKERLLCAFGVITNVLFAKGTPPLRMASEQHWNCIGLPLPTPGRGSKDATP